MRHVQALLTLLGLLSACAHPSCGPETARGGQSREAREKNRAAPSESAAEESLGVAVESKEIQVLGKIKARRGGVGVRYVAPEATELEAFGSWFRALVSASESNTAPARNAPTGFELDSSDSPLWLAGERAGQRRGAGAFALRAGTASPWVIEAPHTFFDVGTLEIAITCFEVLSARALFVNTVRRSNSQDEDLEQEERADLARSGEADSDLAHAPQSFFLTAHAVFAQWRPSYSVLQIHGFRDELLPQVSAVVSAAGTNASLSAIAEQLQGLLGRDAVRLYPSEVRKFGGTHNVQARLSKDSGAALVHLELSRSLRDRLKSDPGFRRTFALAMKAGMLAEHER